MSFHNVLFDYHYSRILGKQHDIAIELQRAEH